MKLTINENKIGLIEALMSIEGDSLGGSSFCKQVGRNKFNRLKPELREWVVNRFTPVKELVNEDNKFKVK